MIDGTTEHLKNNKMILKGRKTWEWPGGDAGNRVGKGRQVKKESSLIDRRTQTETYGFTHIPRVLVLNVRVVLARHIELLSIAIADFQITKHGFLSSKLSVGTQGGYKSADFAGFYLLLPRAHAQGVK